MIGLPRPSTALGLQADERPADPTQKHWVAPLLHMLGEKACYRPRIFVAGDNDLKDAVITAAGYDLTKPATLPRPLDGAKPQGLRRILYYAGFYLRGDIARPAPIPLVVMEKGMWALTEAGVAVAATLRPHFATDGRNVTNVWIAGQINHHNLYTQLINTITYDPTTRKEREAGEIHDHVDHFLAAKIKNDAFASRIGTCDPPTLREIKKYTLRSTYTTFKRRAQNPIHRESRGALTDAERKAGGPSTAGMIVSDFSRVLQTTDCVRSETQVLSEVIVDNAQTARDLHRLDFDRGMVKVRDAFRRFKPGNHERMFRIFNLMAEGRSVEEIGRREGVRRNRAATLMADVRGAVRDARQASTDALEVLTYVADNPCSTLSNIDDDLAIATKLPVLIAGLLENGRIQAKEFDLRGRTGSVTGYIVTDRGAGFITDRASKVSSDNIIESMSL